MQIGDLRGVDELDALARADHVVDPARVAGEPARVPRRFRDVGDLREHAPGGKHQEGRECARHCPDGDPPRDDREQEGRADRAEADQGACLGDPAVQHLVQSDERDEAERVGLGGDVEQALERNRDEEADRKGHRERE